MADERRGRDERMGPYWLRKRHGETDPELADLGRLYEARNLDTGASALVLLPGPGVSWEPEANWSVRAKVQASPPYVALEVDQAPGSGGMPALAGMLGVLTRMVERMEWSTEAYQHLTRVPGGSLKRWLTSAARMLGTLLLYGLYLVSLALVLLLVRVNWHAYTASQQARQAAASQTAGQPVEEHRAPTLVDAGGGSPAVLAYPLPKTPFSDQAKAPCLPRKGEVELHGGCWVELAKRPPCYEDQAEYQGKCYLPVSARSRKPREPQSLHP